MQYCVVGAVYEPQLGLTSPLQLAARDFLDKIRFPRRPQVAGTSDRRIKFLLPCRSWGSVPLEHLADSA